MTDRENYLRMVRFERPDYIPMSYCINGACWKAYPQEQLLDLMEAHPFLFPDFKRPELPFHPQIHPVARKGRPFRDDWGCIWETTCDGITGTVTGHPLEDWERFSDYLPLDPEKVMGIGPLTGKRRRRQLRRPGNGENWFFAAFVMGILFSSFAISGDTKISFLIWRMKNPAWIN